MVIRGRPYSYGWPSFLVQGMLGTDHSTEVNGMSNQAMIVPDTAEPLCRLIKAIESSNNFCAMRFERKVFNRITDKGFTPVIGSIQKFNHCSSDTARMIYSTSWGAYQMMGFNLYDGLKVPVSIGEFLKDYCLQDETFYQYVQWKNILYTIDELRDDRVKRDMFSLRYNGSTDYSIKIETYIKSLGL
jgi:hypothetical protein